MEDDNVPRKKPGRNRARGSQNSHTGALRRTLAGIALAVIGIADALSEVTFGARVPGLQRHLNATKGDIGDATAAFQFGLLLGCLTYTFLGGRRGSRRFLLAGAILAFPPLVGIGILVDRPPELDKLVNLAPELGMLVDLPLEPGRIMALKVLWGIGGLGLGLLTPAWVTQVIRVSRENHGLQTYQAWRQVAGVGVGGALAALALYVLVPVERHFFWVGAATTVGCILAVAFLPSGDRETPDTPGHEVSRWGLLVPGLVLAATVIPLALALNWAPSVIKHFGAPTWLETAGQVGFAVATAISMFGFKALSDRRPKDTAPRRAIRAVIFAAIGTVLLAGLWFVTDGSRLVPDGLWLATNHSSPVPEVVAYTVAIAGFVLVGGGVAPVLGEIQRAAGNMRVGGLGQSARVGWSTCVQFLVVAGAMWGIGRLAEVKSIRITGAVPVALCVCLVVLFLGRGWLRYSVPPETGATLETAVPRPPSTEPPAPTDPRASRAAAPVIAWLSGPDGEEYLVQSKVRYPVEEFVGRIAAVAESLCPERAGEVRANCKPFTLHPAIASGVDEHLLDSMVRDAVTASVADLARELDSDASVTCMHIHGTGATLTAVFELTCARGPVLAAAHELIDLLKKRFHELVIVVHPALDA